MGCAYNRRVAPELVQKNLSKLQDAILLEGVEIDEKNLDLLSAPDDVFSKDPEFLEHIGSNTVHVHKRNRAKGIKLDFKDLSAVRPTIRKIT